MRAAIIGCGYVGSRVASQWHRAGNEVTVTTTTPDKKSQLQAIADQVVVLEGNDLPALEQVLVNQDVVLLSVGAKESSPAGYAKAYLETANNLVEVLKTNTSVKQVIYTSSYGILSNQNGDTVDETIAVYPATEKGKTMHSAERVLLGASDSRSKQKETRQNQLKTCILRLSGIYGEGRELIKIFARVAGTTRPGAGKEHTNWVHVEDIVRAIDFAAHQHLEGIYNLTSDEILTTQEFFDQLFQAHNLPTVSWDSSQPSGRSLNLKLSNQKLKDAGFNFIHPRIEFDLKIDNKK